MGTVLSVRLQGLAAIPRESPRVGFRREELRQRVEFPQALAAFVGIGREEVAAQ